MGKRKWPRVLLPQKRKACPRCAVYRDRGEPMPVECVFCLARNWHLYPDDYPMFQFYQEELDVLARKKRFGQLKEAEPRRINKVGERRGSHSGGIARLTPAQRRLYDERLAAALQRAKLAGKRTDGAHIQPYRMGVLSRIFWKNTRGIPERNRYRMLRRMVSRFKKIKMLQRLGMLDEYGNIKTGTTPAAVATAPWAQRPRTAYTSLE